MFAILPIILLLAALADIITRDSWQVKHLPKTFWIIMVILIPLVGSILWFTIGREWSKPGETVSFGDPRRWQTPRAPDRAPAGSTEQQLAAIDAEIAYYENQAKLRRLEAEVEAKRKDERG